MVRYKCSRCGGDQYSLEIKAAEAIKTILEGVDRMADMARKMGIEVTEETLKARA